MGSNLGCGPQTTADSPATQEEPPFDTVSCARPSTISDAAKRSISKTKKRKPSSQNPPVITPSDASEDDNEPPKTRGVSVASSISHRSKRIVPNSSCQPPDSLEIKHQAVKENSAHGPKKTHREDSIFQPPSPLTSSHSSTSRHSVGFSLSHSKRNNKQVSDASGRLNRASCNFRKRRKMKLTSALSTRPSKRPRCLSMPALGGKPEEVSKAPNVRAILHRSMIQTRPTTGLPLTRKNILAKAKARRKRTRPEFESGLVESVENVSVDFCEPLGPDSRPLRPLPRKVRKERLVPVADNDTVICGVPCGTPSRGLSLECADQFLQDVGNNALAVLREGVGPDMSDWTQDREQDAECDDFAGHDQDEADDTQVTSAASSSMDTPKPPVPAPPRIWAQVDCFILPVNS